MKETTIFNGLKFYIKNNKPYYLNTNRPVRCEVKAKAILEKANKEVS